MKSNGQVSTIRDDKQAVTQLKRALDTAFALHDPVGWKAAYPGIELASDTFRGNTWVPDGFEDTVKDCLSSIEAKPLGKRLLTQISAKCQGRARSASSSSIPAAMPWQDGRPAYVALAHELVHAHHYVQSYLPDFTWAAVTATVFT